MTAAPVRLVPESGKYIRFGFDKLADEVPDLFYSARVRVRESRCIGTTSLSGLLRIALHELMCMYGTRAERHVLFVAAIDFQRVVDLTLFYSAACVRVRASRRVARSLSVFLRGYCIADSYGDVADKRLEVDLYDSFSILCFGFGLM